MVDLSFIGKEGIIVQYEDIVSLLGFNIVKYLRSKHVNDIACRMSIDDILQSYFDRETEDVSIWLKKEYDIDININDYLTSEHTFKPNMLYSYRIFLSAYKNGIKNLIIHSNTYSPVIEKYIETYQLPIKYTCGDIIPVLKANKNSTFLTSSPSNIRKCLDINTPIALTIVDDFMYVADIIRDKIDEKLREKNVYVCYTSIISAGIV